MKRIRFDKYEGPLTKGIDVSKYQGEIDWYKVQYDPQNIEFVFVRFGDGKDIDPTCRKNVEGALSADLHVGLYQYFRADRGGKEQAENLLAFVRSLPKDKSFLLAIDVEDGSFKNLPQGILDDDADQLPTDVVLQELTSCLTTLQEAGCEPLIYTGQTFHWRVSQVNQEWAKPFGEFALWTPDYTGLAVKGPRMPVDLRGEPCPWKEWTFWQYSSKGAVQGIQGPVDMNVFRGSTKDLFNYWDWSFCDFVHEPTKEKYSNTELCDEKWSNKLIKMDAKLDEILSILKKCDK